jgi:antitoxin CcdA
MRIGASHMNHPAKIDSPKRATNVSLSSDLVDEAKRLGVNLSQACEKGLAEQVKMALGEQWKRENKDAIESWNQWIDKNGLPLAKYRQF